MIMTEKTISFSIEAQLAKAIMYKNNNDIIVFVEDEKMEYFYNKLFERLLVEDDIVIQTVFPLNGKHNIIDTYNFHNEELKLIVQNKPIFYLVDGDFDSLIRKEEMIIDNNFIYLNKYNIESYLLQEYALVESLQGYAELDFETCKNLINFNEWKNRIALNSTELFLLFAWTQKYIDTDPPENVKSALKYIDQSTGLVFDNSIQEYHAHIDQNIENIDSELLELRSKMNMFDDPLDIVCGKFLLHSFKIHAKNLTQSKSIPRQNPFTWDLIRHIDLSQLSYIRERIIKVTQ